MKRKAVGVLAFAVTLFMALPALAAEASPYQQPAAPQRATQEATKAQQKSLRAPMVLSLADADVGDHNQGNRPPLVLIGDKDPKKAPEEGLNIEIPDLLLSPWFPGRGAVGVAVDVTW